jgi:hypothetical protein
MQKLWLVRLKEFMMKAHNIIVTALPHVAIIAIIIISIFVNDGTWIDSYLSKTIKIQLAVEAGKLRVLEIIW